MNIFKLCEQFYKIASIKSDMAERVMTSVIQAIDPHSFDYPAALLAVKGAKDLIRYGTLACQKEMSHYTDMAAFFEEIPYMEMVIVNKGTLPGLIHYLDKMEDAFYDYDNWGVDYGGERWQEIAKTLKELAKNYLQVLSTEPYTEENKKAIKDTIVMMNIFDQQQHNTGTIYTKLIQLESDIKGTEQTPLSEISDLMNSKEIKDPIDVYKFIEKHLEMKLPYKDYIELIRSNPEFYKKDMDDIKNEIDNVGAQKEIKEELPGMINTIEVQLMSIEKLTKTKNYENEKIDSIPEYGRNMFLIINNIRNCSNNIFRDLQYQPYRQYINSPFMIDFKNNLDNYKYKMQMQLNSLEDDYSGGINSGLMKQHVIKETGGELTQGYKQKKTDIINKFLQDFAKTCNELTSYLKSLQ